MEGVRDLAPVFLAENVDQGHESDILEEGPTSFGALFLAEAVPTLFWRLSLDVVRDFDPVHLPLLLRLH
jgi:hypothetical protein